jgi:beta-lactamase superfamily II metal-dependent hydrolase
VAPTRSANNAACLPFLSRLPDTRPRVLGAAVGNDPEPLGNVQFRVFNPPAASLAADSNDFDDSTVLVIDYLGTRVLLAGDIHSRGEDALAEAGLAALAPFAVLRVADHASASSTSERFLWGTVRPHYAVVSYGTGRGAGVPDPSTMDRLRAQVGQVFTTAEHGSVTIQIAPYSVRLIPSIGEAVGT